VIARPLSSQKTAAIAVAGGLLALAVVPPLASLAVDLARSAGSAGLLASSRLWLLLGRTVLLAAAVTAVEDGARASYPRRGSSAATSLESMA